MNHQWPKFTPNGPKTPNGLMPTWSDTLPLTDDAQLKHAGPLDTSFGALLGTCGVASGPFCHPGPQSGLCEARKDLVISWARWPESQFRGHIFRVQPDFFCGFRHPSEWSNCTPSPEFLPLAPRPFSPVLDGSGSASCRGWAALGGFRMIPQG